MYDVLLHVKILCPEYVQSLSLRVAVLGALEPERAKSLCSCPS